jgi:hypothetical protein
MLAGLMSSKECGGGVNFYGGLFISTILFHLNRISTSISTTVSLVYYIIVWFIMKNV